MENNTEEIIYSPEVLDFLRNKLDDAAIGCLESVAKTKGELGLLKTKVPEFKTKRRAIETAFAVLEAQGFVETRQLGNMRPYFLTVRGEQLIDLINNEKE
ncbi:hypothetical protein [Cytobacillus oceanisediminis]|uniref:hypothetical protein n=1 Tax=Cytobacillus oceanisediminis TaxID=665099 RepID=UPI0020400801|nr:hypothetical protein [Cytobacillus oceanisediminis]MCM3402982.1 hypothetical protein [Cytobacillus oceanisediminis]